MKDEEICEACGGSGCKYSLKELERRPGTWGDFLALCEVCNGIGKAQSGKAGRDG